MASSKLPNHRLSSLPEATRSESIVAMQGDTWVSRVAKGNFPLAGVFHKVHGVWRVGPEHRTWWKDVSEIYWAKTL